jgi:hypothetical protein
MTRIKAEEIVKVFTATLLYNIVFALFLYVWVTDEDIENLPNDPLEKAWTVFFLAITTFATIGFGEFGSVRVRSKRGKLVITFFILLAISGAASFLFDF